MSDEKPAAPPARPELATMLATEHWSLLGTRSMTWSEIMSRISLLLTVMSAFLVVLALVAQGVGFDRSLLGLGTGFAAASLVVGSLTALRVALASQEDAQLIRGMNRLRSAYVELAPEIAPYLTASTKDNHAGLMATYTLGNKRPSWCTSSVARPSSSSSSTRSSPGLSAPCSPRSRRCRRGERRHAAWEPAWCGWRCSSG